MIKIFKVIFIVLSFTFFSSMFLLFPDNSSAKVYINIYQAGIKKARIAVPDLKNISTYGQHPEISGIFARIVRHDLSVIGYFHIVNPLSYLEDPQFSPINADMIDYTDWTVLNAQYLVNGEYMTENGSLTIKANLISIYSKRLLFSETLSGKDGQYRYLAAKFADDVVKFLTGINGPFTTRVFFVGENAGSKNIFSMDFGGHDVKKITSNNSINILPYPAPDGKNVAFVSFKQGYPAIFIKNISSGAERKLRLPGPADFVSWSPDGKKLAVAVTADHYNTEIYILNPDGTGLRKLTFTEGINTSPSFSPGGNRIAFVSNRGGSPQIYVMNSNGSGQQRITFDGRYYNTSPSWSPDGKKIAFTSFVKGALQVFIMNPDGSDERQVTFTPYSAEHPSWTRDSRIITFNTEISGRNALYMINVNESGMTVLSPVLFPALSGYSDPEWTLSGVY